MNGVDSDEEVVEAVKSLGTIARLGSAIGKWEEKAHRARSDEGRDAAFKSRDEVYGKLEDLLDLVKLTLMRPAFRPTAEQADVLLSRGNKRYLLIGLGKKLTLDWWLEVVTETDPGPQVRVNTVSGTPAELKTRIQDEWTGAYVHATGAVCLDVGGNGCVL